MTDYVIASTKALRVWDFYPDRETAEQALPVVKQKYLNDAQKWERFHEDYSHREPDYWLKQAAQDRLIAEDCQVMTFDEYKRDEEQQLLSDPIQVITQEQYDYALNVLPPLRYGVNAGVRSFFMSEFHSGNYTHQYADVGGKYFCKLVNFAKPSTWITEEMIRAAAAV